MFALLYESCKMCDVTFKANRTFVEVFGGDFDHLHSHIGTVVDNSSTQQ